MQYELKQKAASGIWFVEFEDKDGARRRISLKTRDRSTAMSRRHHVLANFDKVILPAGSSDQRMTMAQLFDRCRQTVWAVGECKSQATIRSQLKILNEMIGDVAVADMDYDRLTKLQLDLSARGYAPATVKRKMEGVSRALTEATKLKHLDKPIITGKPAIPKITVKNLKSRVISGKEEAAIFAAVAKREKQYPLGEWARYAAFLRFLRYTGCRLAEALETTADDIEIRGDSYFVTFARYKTKNDQPRILPLADPIVADLEYLKAAARGGKLYPFKAANAWYRFSNIRTDLLEEGINIEDVVLHTYRHTCLTAMAKSGKLKIQDISLWAGHSSIQVTMERYLHMIPEYNLGGLVVLNELAAAVMLGAKLEDLL